MRRMIGERIKEIAMEEWEPYPPMGFLASWVGHPCARYLYHAWVDYDKAVPPPERLREVFAEERAQEKAVKLALASAGFRIVLGQTKIEINDPPIIGWIDGRLCPERQLDGWPMTDRGDPRAVIYEIKSVSQRRFSRINSLADMLNSELWYERMWPTQLQLYIHAIRALGVDVGIFLLKDKSRFTVKDIWVEEDPLYVSWILERARDVHRRIISRDPPERTEGEQCHSCEFRRACKPNILYGAAEEEGADIIDCTERAMGAVEEIGGAA